MGEVGRIDCFGRGGVVFELKFIWSWWEFLFFFGFSKFGFEILGFRICLFRYGFYISCEDGIRVLVFFL